MLLKVRNINTQVFGTPEERSWLDLVLSVEVEGSRFVRNFWNLRWDGYHHFYKRGVLPTGLVPYILRTANEEEVKIEIQDERDCPGLPLPVSTELADGENKKILLRKDQISSAKILLEKKRGILESPPASGKTETLIAVLDSLKNAGRSLVLVHTRELLFQWIERIVKRGFAFEEIGCITREDWLPNRFTIASTQTLFSRIEDSKTRDFLKTIKVVLIEECQLGGAKRYQTLLNLMPNAYYRYGFSATALDYDDERNFILIGSLGPLRHKVDIEELAGNGVIPEVFYHFLPVPRILRKIPENYPDSSSRMRAGARACGRAYHLYLYTHNSVYTMIRRITRLYPNDQVLITINVLKHGTLLYKSIPNGVDLYNREEKPHGKKFFEKEVDFAHGKLETKIRDEKILAFVEGKTHILIASPILDYGIDIPAIRVIILAGGFESPIRLVQRIGRTLRKKLGNNSVHVYDFDFGDVPYLGEHSQSRLRTFKERFPGAVITNKFL